MRRLPLVRLAMCALLACASLLTATRPCHAQAALLLEEPYGFFGLMIPTGHNAIYFQRICAETPTHLRRCHAGELGVVIARYQGISKFDWIAIPLLPYLYSVEDPSQVPTLVRRNQVSLIRQHYFDTHLADMATDLKPGGFWSGGWTELIGVAYERRIFAYRFQTSEEQDDALIEQLNRAPNRTHFNLVFNNCADFSRVVLNHYFPGAFRRALFPDARITTPKQITARLVRHARRHPEIDLKVFEIPQIPGHRGASHSNRGVAESLVTTGYAVPIAFLNPYLAGGLLLDYLIRGRFHVRRNQTILLTPNLLPEFAGIQSAPASEPSTAAALAGTAELVNPAPPPGYTPVSTPETTSAPATAASLPMQQQP